MSAALLTGATGSLGIQVLRVLCTDRRFTRVYCLVRPRIGAPARIRLEQHARLHGFELAPQVTVVQGDLHQPGLGLGAAERDALLERVTHVFHCAADVRFNQPLVALRRSNVEGTRAVLDLCAGMKKHGRGFCHLVYVGTAYVAGQRGGVVDEDSFEHDAGFKNAYEQSKFEAERLVRARADIPSIILRPSIIWSLDGEGRMPPKSAVYPAIKLYQKWPLSAIPVFTNTLDIVPADYVARAIATLGVDAQNVGHTFHLAAGASGEISLRRFYRLLDEAFRTAGHPRRVRHLPPWAFRLYWPLRRAEFERKARGAAALNAYLPYAEMRNPRFSVDRARTALRPHGIVIPASEPVVANTLAAVVTGMLRLRSA
jgi:thioester reductase-like protein